MDGKSQPTTSELIILIAGAVMLVASFLTFLKFGSQTTTTWGTGAFPIATLLPLYGVLMAAQIALTRFANVKMPANIAGFTWQQVHLALGILAGLMALGWLITDTLGDKQIGYWLEVLGGLALAVGAIMMQQERPTGAIG